MTRHKRMGKNLLRKKCGGVFYNSMISSLPCGSWEASAAAQQGPSMKSPLLLRIKKTYHVKNSYQPLTKKPSSLRCSAFYIRYLLILPSIRRVLQSLDRRQGSWRRDGSDRFAGRPNGGRHHRAGYSTGRIPDGCGTSRTDRCGNGRAP